LFHCTACKGYFPEHHGPLLHGKQVAVALMVRVLACLAEGLGIRATARGCEVDPHTVLPWLGEAVDQRQALARSCLCEGHVRQIPVDELSAVRRAMQAGDLSEDEALRRLSRAPHWCGQPWILRRNDCWRLTWGHAPWPWPSGGGIRWRGASPRT